MKEFVSRCPKTGRLINQNNFQPWFLPIAGFLSLIWVMIRVIPKPNRATYPCMKTAGPLAGGFLFWISGVWISSHMLRKMGSFLRKNYLYPAIFCCGVTIISLCFSLLVHPAQLIAAKPGTRHPALGTPQGLYPGRVVWVHQPAVTDWKGPGIGERWYDHTNQAMADQMVSRAVQAYAGVYTDREAWRRIFQFFNRYHGKKRMDYTPGEGIMIKINLSTCNAVGATCDTAYHKIALADSIDNSPQILHALLEQLTRVAGVSGRDITIGDPTGLFPDYLYNYLEPDFPEVRYLDNRGTHRRYRVEFSRERIFWSTSKAKGNLPDYLPQSYIQAAYLINAAVLKGHSAGITLCAKNHYGSLIRCPNGRVRDKTKTQNYYDLHNSLPSADNPGMGKYRALVDLMGHRDLGGKTLLYIIDGIFAGYYWDGKPCRWHSEPFNNHWPSSLFLSMDPVAIDSVGYDFLLNEWPDVVKYGSGKRTGGGLGGGAEDYLHEAALAGNPPSGSRYDPEADGKPLTSLGVHEHWKSQKSKIYSGNIKQGAGIELIKVL